MTPQGSIRALPVDRTGYAEAYDYLVEDGDGNSAFLGFVGQEIVQVEEPVQVEGRLYNIGRKVQKSRWYAVIPSGIDLETAGFINQGGNLGSTPTWHETATGAREALLDWRAVRGTRHSTIREGEEF